MGKKAHLGTKYWGNLSYPSTKKGQVLLLKLHFFYLEKGTFWVLELVGEQAPPPPDSYHLWLHVPLQGQRERFTGTIDRFRRCYKGPNVKG